jgi:hypothetical protein
MTTNVSTYDLAIQNGNADDTRSYGGVCTRLDASGDWAVPALLQHPGSEEKLIKPLVLPPVANACHG